MRKPTVRRNLAENLRIIRLLRNWSQEDLAEMTGLHRTYIGSVERAERNVSLDNLEKLSTALGKSIAELTSEPDLEAVCEQILERIRDAVDGKPVRIREEAVIYSMQVMGEGTGVKRTDPVCSNSHEDILTCDKGNAYGMFRVSIA